MDADSYFHPVDRNNNRINSGGFNLLPPTIGQAIDQHPAVLGKLPRHPLRSRHAEPRQVTANTEQQSTTGAR